MLLASFTVQTLKHEGHSVHPKAWPKAWEHKLLRAGQKQVVELFCIDAVFRCKAMTLFYQINCFLRGFLRHLNWSQQPVHWRSLPCTNLHDRLWLTPKAAESCLALTTLSNWISFALFALTNCCHVSQKRRSGDQKEKGKLTSHMQVPNDQMSAEYEALPWRSSKAAHGKLPGFETHVISDFINFPSPTSAKTTSPLSLNKMFGLLISALHNLKFRKQSLSTKWWSQQPPFLWHNFHSRKLHRCQFWKLYGLSFYILLVPKPHPTPGPSLITSTFV